MEFFADRVDAGRVLGEQVAGYLRRYADQVKGPRLVLALAPGGVPVAEQVALAIGGKLGGLPADGIAGRTVVVVDDGLATVAAARAALHEVRRAQPVHLIFAVPVCSGEAADELAGDADAVLCAQTPLHLAPAGDLYHEGSEVREADAAQVLARWSSSEVRIPVVHGLLDATMEEPAKARGVVLFAHGSGSSRRSPRNRMVAERLNRAGYTTVLLDLLTPGEAAADERTAQWRFDIGMLAERLVSVIDWLAPHGLPIGLFGASTGAAAALVAAAERPKAVSAVVSRGGRPDLAGVSLSRVTAPTLLIVGGDDEIVIALNESAAEVLADHAKVVVVPGASHLFAEPGALERVAELAVDFFDLHL